MDCKNILTDMQNKIDELHVLPDNLVLAITKLLEITHAHGLDNEAIKALFECGIKLEIEA